MSGEIYADYQVVVNDEEQYSLWPSVKRIPPGWHAAGYSGPKAAVLARIEQLWTDMRPRSVREDDADRARERTAHG